MRNGFLKRAFLVLCLSLLLLNNAQAKDRDKKKYEVSEMPKALYLTAPDSPEARLEFSSANCPELKPKDNSAYSYLEMLVSAGERRSGSQEMRCAVEAVKKLLESFGYYVEVQNYRFPYYKVDKTLFEFKEKDSGKIYPSFPLMYSPETNPEISGKVVSPERIEKGSMVYVRGEFLGRKSLGQQAKEWKEKGAIGLVLDPRMFPFNTSGLLFPRSIHSTSWHYGALPGAVVQGAEDLVGKEVIWRNNCKIYAGQGYNVIARSPGEFEDYIIIGAHLDSWFLGALDDGSGVAVMMRIAELLKDEPEGNTGFIFVAFDSEELGLFGSQYFYEKFGADKVKAMLNLDMVSVKNNFLHKDPAKAKIMPKVISSAPELKDISRQTYAIINATKFYTGLSWWRTIYGGLPTDYEWFYSAGVPGVFIYTPDRYYHTPLDNMQWQDRADLEAVSSASAELVKKIAGTKMIRPAQPLEMEFSLFRQDDGTIAFDMKAKKDTKYVQVEKPLVYCYYEHGLEKKVDLKSAQGGWYRGSFSPLYRGEYQFVAVAEYKKDVRKIVKSMRIDEPIKEEKGDEK